MLKSFLNFFRLEKALYHWRERPSPSAFMMNFERKYRPKKFQMTIMKLIRFWSISSGIFAAICILLLLLSRPSTSIGVIFGAWTIIFIALFMVSLSISIASAFMSRTIGIFDKVMRIEGENVSWKYQEFEYFAFTQMIYPSNDLRCPCLVLVNRNQQRLIVGIPNPEIALRVTEILSSRMTLRTDYEPIMLENEKP